jgi:hypothetical protein
MSSIGTSTQKNNFYKRVFLRLKANVNSALLNCFPFLFAFQVRKDGFKDNPAVLEELDLVDEDDQITHMFTLDDATNG